MCPYVLLCSVLLCSAIAVMNLRIMANIISMPIACRYYEAQSKDLSRIVELVRGKIPKLVRKTCEAMVGSKASPSCCMFVILVT